MAKVQNSKNCSITKLIYFLNWLSISEQMSSKAANATLKARTTQPAQPAPAVATPSVVEEQPGSGDETSVKKPRQAYEPKSVLEFEQEITNIAEGLRGFKTRLYPTSAPKASAEKAPTRREIDDQISAVNALKRDYKAQSRRADQKPRRKTTPSNGKARTGGFKNPCVVDEGLAQFIAENFNTDAHTIIDSSRICTRALLTSMLTQYAFDNELRDPANATKVRPDAAMRELFKDDFTAAGVDPTGFPHTHMQKLLTRHVLTSDKFKEHIASEKIDAATLETYKVELEKTQEYFKGKKAQREAARPKPKKKTAAKKADVVVASE